MWHLPLNHGSGTTSATVRRTCDTSITSNASITSRRTCTRMRTTTSSPATSSGVSGRASISIGGRSRVSECDIRKKIRPYLPATQAWRRSQQQQISVRSSSSSLRSRATSPPISWQPTATRALSNNVKCTCSQVRSDGMSLATPDPYDSAPMAP
jgi:hypothetical protein